ncbi:MAG: UDP-N-acetylmuramoyl-L-alanyl-D-glutamate--2,6-diaminopimelate ligase [bacterium]|nr:UDP-N-acetylmuramoyl-L-alanyl-D-glutamate--2,6-diaminopimelate ligase [bacterium]
MPLDSAMTLSAVADAVRVHQEVTRVGADVALSDAYMDSRAVTPGSLYVAIRGSRVDGHAFIEGAIARGAAAVVVEEPPPVSIPYLLVEDTRQALGWIAAAVHNYPSRKLSVVGITGTNGKTTVAHMMAAMSDGSARTTAVIGTVSANLEGVVVSPRTTPEASELQRILHHLLDSGRITDVAVEVSSHAMVMGRVTGTEFDIVAFTNLSQDHLDYHHTMEDYFQAKAGLFDGRWAPQGVIWVDDAWGRRLATESLIPVVTVGAGPGADVSVGYVADTPTGSTFEIVIDGAARLVTTSLAGRFNVANAAIALTCAHLQGWDIDHAIARLESMDPIPGRYNTIATDDDLWVVVDYAHTPDAISQVIRESRVLADGKIVAIVGAGGDRDREKRPLMGQAISEADFAIITTDNPRSEDPTEIIDQMLRGVPEQADLTIEPDRRLAIRRALAAADSGDVVLILGKGHEAGQEFADHTIEFNDSVVAAEELRLRESR